MLKNAQRQVAYALKDPDAEVRNLAISKNGSFVCGEVKAKKGIDGYPGFERFIDTGAWKARDDANVDIERDADDDSFAARWSEYCPG